MQLFRAAKLISGLRLLIVTAAPIVTTSAALLSVRGAAYLAGAALGSIGVTLWPIILSLISISGIVATTTSECDAYQAELRRIQLANEAAQIAAKPLIEAWQIQANIWSANASAFYAVNIQCLEFKTRYFAACSRDGCFSSSQEYCDRYPQYPLPPPQYPVIPYISYSNHSSGCPGSSAPNCPNSKKVWLQTVWASKGDFATDTKSCFLIGYSYSILDGLKIEYNPFELKETFLESRAMNPFLVAGDRFRNFNDSEWKNLESVVGWDKGYWKAEQTDVECRGWNPGWSRKVK